MTLPDPQLICTRPFEWFEVHPDGSVFLCCPAWLQRPVGNLMRQSVEDIWNGPVAREIRKSILNGSFHNCSSKRCPKRATNAKPIQKLAAVKDETVQAAITHGRDRVDYRPRHLNLCFDLTCNLACPSCRPGQRSVTAQERSRIAKIQAQIASDLLPYATGLTLSGFGEPFASPSYYGLLKLLTPQRFPRLQNLRLHTNGQLFTSEAWEQLPGIHGLLSEVEISLDAATEATYRLNRPGGELAQVLMNLEFLKELPVRRVLSMVVQQNNWREIPEFLALARRYAAEAYLAPLVNWGTFSRVEYRQRAVHRREHPEHADFASLLRQIRHRPLLTETILLPTGC